MYKKQKEKEKRKGERRGEEKRGGEEKEETKSNEDKQGEAEGVAEGDDGIHVCEHARHGIDEPPRRLREVRQGQGRQAQL